jgi:hypothetical protein
MVFRGEMELVGMADTSCESGKEFRVWPPFL